MAMPVGGADATGVAGTGVTVPLAVSPRAASASRSSSAQRPIPGSHATYRPLRRVPGPLHIVHGSGGNANDPLPPSCYQGKRNARITEVSLYATQDKERGEDCIFSTLFV